MLFYALDRHSRWPFLSSAIFSPDEISPPRQALETLTYAALTLPRKMYQSRVVTCAMPLTNCEILGRKNEGHASASSITSSSISQQYHTPVSLHRSGLESVAAINEEREHGGFTIYRMPHAGVEALCTLRLILRYPAMQHWALCKIHSHSECYLRLSVSCFSGEPNPFQEVIMPMFHVCGTGHTCCAHHLIQLNDRTRATSAAFRP